MRMSPCVTDMTEIIPGVDDDFFNLSQNEQGPRLTNTSCLGYAHIMLNAQDDASALGTVMGSVAGTVMAGKMDGNIDLQDNHSNIAERVAFDTNNIHQETILNEFQSSDQHL